MNVELRAMESGDFAGAMGLWQVTEGMGLSAADSAEGVGRFLRRNPGLSGVAVAGGLVVGTALCGHDGRRGFIYHLAVATAYRGQGLGRALVERCLAGLVGEGIGRVHVVVYGSNATGRAFWEHLGFGARLELQLCTRVLG
jgi:ribosomal protein S18 acetylase RimI-like enzyme